MIAGLLALIPAPWLALVKALPWRLIGAAALMAVIAGLGWRVSAWHTSHRELAGVRAQLVAERSCAEGTACARAISRLQAKGIDAVRKARQAAQEAARDAQAKRDAEVRLEAERLAAAASEAAARAQSWRRRYEASLATPACAAWAAQEVPCAISD